MCASLAVAGDPHRQCFLCLGSEHTRAGIATMPDCMDCRSIPITERQMLQHLEMGLRFQDGIELAMDDEQSLRAGR